MLLFDPDTPNAFEDGRWAKPLRDMLEPSYLRELLKAPSAVVIAPHWKAAVKLWHYTFYQWIQFERDNWPPGPHFWRGKPAVLSSPSALYAGYYVERGYPPGQPAPATPEQIMEDGDTNWDWGRFVELLSEESAGDGQEDEFSGLLLPLPVGRRCIWVCDSTTDRCGQPFYFQGRHTLVEVLKHVKEIKRDHWIDLVVGVEYSLSECVHLQDGLVKELVQVDSNGVAAGPLKQAYELCRLVRPDEDKLI